MGPGYPFMPPVADSSAEIAELREQLEIATRSIDAVTVEVTAMAEEITAPAATAPATTLPPGYLQERATFLLAQHVVEAKRAEPEPEFGGDDAYPDYGPEEDAAAAMGLPTPVTGTAPAPEPEPTDASTEAPDVPYTVQRTIRAAATLRDRNAGPVARFLADNVEPGTDEDYIDSPTLRGMYDTWRQAAGEPELTPRSFGAGMSAAGVRRKQAIKAINGAKPMLYYGIRLPGTTPRAERSAEPKPVPGSAEHIRAIAEQAKRRAREAAEQQAAPPAPEPEVKAKSNNGWTDPKAPTAGEDLTLAQLQAENAAKVISRASNYTGPRPRTEDIFDQETKDLVNGVLDLDCGFEFVPITGRSKAFVRTPDGSRFPLATTHGGSVGRVGNNRQLRRWLNRKGYLPTAAAPASQLTVPTKATATPGGGVTIVKADGSQRSLADEVAIAEADPGAEPLTPEELDKMAFELYEDVRDGLPGAYPFIYHPNVLALNGLNTDEVETAIRKPERIEIRPETKAKGYPVFAFQRGDVRAILGFRDRAKPSVIACYWTTLLANDTYRVERTGGGGSRTMSGLPSNPGASMKRLRQLGATVAPASNGKTAVVSYGGQELGQITTGVAIPKATVQSDYQRCLRKMHAIDQREGATA